MKALARMQYTAYKLVQEAANSMMDIEIRRRAQELLKQYDKQMNQQIMAAMRLAARRGVMDQMIKWYKEWWKTNAALAAMFGHPYSAGPFGLPGTDILGPP